MTKKKQLLLGVFALVVIISIAQDKLHSQANSFSDKYPLSTAYFYDLQKFMGYKTGNAERLIRFGGQDKRTAGDALAYSNGKSTFFSDNPVIRANGLANQCFEEHLGKHQVICPHCDELEEYLKKHNY